MRCGEGTLRIRGLAFASLGELARASSIDSLTAGREWQRVKDETELKLVAMVGDIWTLRVRGGLRSSVNLLAQVRLIP